MEDFNINVLNNSLKQLISEDKAAATIDLDRVTANSDGFLFLGTRLIETALMDPPIDYKNCDKEHGFVPPDWERIFTPSHYIYGFTIQIEDDMSTWIKKNIPSKETKEKVEEQKASKSRAVVYMVLILIIVLLIINGAYELVIK